MQGHKIIKPVHSLTHSHTVMLLAGQLNTSRHVWRALRRFKYKRYWNIILL